MADTFPQVSVDAKAVTAKFNRLPEALRARLRSELVPITKALGDRVRAKLSPGALGISARTGLPLFATTNRLLPSIKVQLVESTSAIAGRVFADPGRFPAVAAMSLEYGARAHEIAAKGGGSLFFFWARMGKNVAFRKVNHPGFPGASFLRSSLEEIRPEATARLVRAAAETVQKG